MDGSGENENGLVVSSVASTVPKHIKVVQMHFGAQGPYAGDIIEFHLKDKPRSQRVCVMGRSKGKKFTPPRGLSLSLDDEVSSKHAEVRGMVHRWGGRMMYT